MTYEIVLKDRLPVTHDTNKFTFNKPEGLEFEPGQAAELSLNIEGFKDEGRPFTFTSQPDDHDLEFVIKSYPDHNGVTEQMANLTAGTTAQLDGPFGAITDHGPGVFLAAGAGITPFIPILRKHDREGTMDGCTLIFSNKTEEDIIMRGEWESMQNLETIFTVTDSEAEGLRHGQVDKEFLKDHVKDFDQTFYICGPGGFVDDVRAALKDLGAKADNIVTEEGW
ncbi:MAG: flavodoxin reductase [Sulfitobacter sp.]|nr:flavodoxin reductase [Sulfitobacter sp.]